MENPRNYQYNGIQYSASDLLRCAPALNLDDEETLQIVINGARPKQLQRHFCIMAFWACD